VVSAAGVEARDADGEMSVSAASGRAAAADVEASVCHALFQAWPPSAARRRGLSVLTWSNMKEVISDVVEGAVSRESAAHRGGASAPRAGRTVCMLTISGEMS